MSKDESDPHDLDLGPDPVAFVAATSEPSIGGTDGGDEDADAPVYAVGVGSGSLGRLMSHGRQTIQEADVIVGFETVVDFIADETDADLFTYGYADEVNALAELGRCIAAGDRGATVLMGDLNHSGYQFLGKVQRTVERPVRVIPGIPSLQMAANHAQAPMKDTRFITLHKSGPFDVDLDRLAETVNECHLPVLSRPFDWIPGGIAEFLLDSDADASLDALVLERLIHDDERVARTTLGGLRNSAGGSSPDSTPYSDLSVLAVKASVGAAN